MLQALANAGNLDSLRVVDLKAYLRAKKLKGVGNKFTKNELIALVMEAEGVPQTQ